MLKAKCYPLLKELEKLRLQNEENRNSRLNDPGLGIDYEIMFAAYMSLKFLLNKQITDFSIESIVSGIGKFDNFVVMMKFNKSEYEQIDVCIPIKTRRKGKPYNACKVGRRKG